MATSRFSPIVVPVDGSPCGEAAFRTALRLAAPDGELIVAHAINRATVVAECVTPYGGDVRPALEALESDERDLFAYAAGEAKARGVRCTTVSLDGRPSATIVELARARNAGSIVMGTHGRRGLARMFVGSTAASVLAEATVPTLVVHEHGDPASLPLRTVLVAIDGSPAANAASTAAIELVSREGGLIVLAHVVELDEKEPLAIQALDEVRANAAAAGVAVDSVLLHENVVDAILAAAETAHADAIALGTHARGGVRFGMGSTAEAIVSRSALPVLVVPPPMVRPGTAESPRIQAVS